MATTVKQDEDFISEMIPSTLLEKAIEWIQGNMSPEEVFETNDLVIWAFDKGFTLDE